MILLKTLTSAIILILLFQCLPACATQELKDGEALFLYNE